MRDVSRLRSWFVLLVLALIGFLLAYIFVQEPLAGEDMKAPLFTTFSLRASSVFTKRARQFIPAFQKAATRPTSSALLSSQLPLGQTQSPFVDLSSRRSIMNTSIKDAVANRRTMYKLTKKSTISDNKIKEIVTAAITNVPSSFNAQSTRLVVLLKEEHDKFWDIVRDALHAIVAEDKWERTANRIAGFRNSYGSVRPLSPEL